MYRSLTYSSDLFPMKNDFSLLSEKFSEAPAWSSPKPAFMPYSRTFISRVEKSSSQVINLVWFTFLDYVSEHTLAFIIFFIALLLYSFVPMSLSVKKETWLISIGFSPMSADLRPQELRSEPIKENDPKLSLAKRTYGNGIDFLSSCLTGTIVHFECYRLHEFSAEALAQFRSNTVTTYALSAQDNMTRIHRTSNKLGFINYDKDALHKANPILSATNVAMLLLERDLLERQRLGFQFAPALGEPIK
jgi:hypothetical protein